MTEIDAVAVFGIYDQHTEKMTAEEAKVIAKASRLQRYKRRFMSILRIVIIVLVAVNIILELALILLTGSFDLEGFIYRTLIPVAMLVLLPWSRALIYRATYKRIGKEYQIVFRESSIYVCEADSKMDFYYQGIQDIYCRNDIIVIGMGSGKMIIGPMSERTLKSGSISELKEFLKAKTGKEIQEI